MTRCSSGDDRVEVDRERAAAPREDREHRLLARVQLVVDRVDDLAGVERQVPAADAGFDRDARGLASREQSLGDVEDAERRQVALDGLARDHGRLAQGPDASRRARWKRVLARFCLVHAALTDEISVRYWSRLIMPSLRPICIAEAIWKVLPSRIMFAIAGVAFRISNAATRPFPPFRVSRRCATTPLRASASMTRICCWSSPGNTSMMRRPRARGAVRVERAEHEVSGLGRRDRELDRLEISHFADQHDVGVLAQRRAQRGRERQRVSLAHLALVDQRHLVLVHELDRVLDREDVRALGRVDVVDHRGVAWSTCRTRSRR